MTLTSKPPLTAVLPKVSLSSTLRQALAARARAAGVSESEAVRQWLTAYLARPRCCALPLPAAGTTACRLSGLPETWPTAPATRRSGSM